MAFIRTVKIKRGMVYHIVEKKGNSNTSKKTPARSLKEAREFLKQYEWERATGKPPSLLIKDANFAQLLQDYGEYAKYRKMESTYSRDLSNFKILNRDFGKFKLQQIDAPLIETVQNKWKIGGKSNKTINNRSILLGTILRFAQERNLLNALPGIRKFKIDKRRPHFYTEDEIDLILTNANEITRNYVIFFLNTGLRLGELQRLKWADIDFENKLVRVEIAKSHCFRAIPINGVLQDLLIRLKNQKTAKQIYVFEFSEGNPVTDYYHRFKKLLGKLQIEGNIHKLRHTFASRLVQKGASIYEVQHLLGHASVQTTQIYAHIRVENLQKAVNLLNDNRGCIEGVYAQNQVTRAA